MRAGIKCKRCSGQMMPDLDGDFYCIQCGKVVYTNLYRLSFDDDQPLQAPKGR